MAKIDETPSTKPDETLAKGELRYYHLQHTQLEQAVLTLISRTLDQGWTCCVKSNHKDVLSWFDQRLWQTEPTAFIPHCLVTSDPQQLEEDTRYACEQSAIILSNQDYAGTLNESSVLFLLDEAVQEQDQDYQRICRLFDGRDTTQLTFARQQWRNDRDAHYALSYWQQNNGKWQQKQ